MAGHAPHHDAWAQPQVLCLVLFYGNFVVSSYGNSMCLISSRVRIYDEPLQPVMTPYEVPYSTIYSPGVYYAHPAVPLVSHGFPL